MGSNITGIDAHSIRRRGHAVTLCIAIFVVPKASHTQGRYHIHSLINILGSVSSSCVIGFGVSTEHVALVRPM